MSIPNPRWSASKTKTGSNPDLLKVMPGWTEQDFQKFREHIQTVAPRLGLDTYADRQAQEPAKWQKLVSDCRRQFPTLDKFEGYWPIDIYYSKYVYWRVQRRKGKSQKHASDSQPQNSNSQKRKDHDSRKDNEQGRSTATNAARAPTQTQATSKKSMSAGTRAENSFSSSSNASTMSSNASNATKSNPGYSRPRNENPFPPNQKTSSTAFRAVKLESNAGVSGPRKENSFPSSQMNSSFTSSALSSSPVFPTSSAPRCSQPKTRLSAPSSSPPFPASSALRSQPAAQLKTRPQWGPCVLCGLQEAPVPPSETAHLHECFKSRADLLRLLALAGVVADHHFRALLRLSAARRGGFLDRLASAGKLTYFEKVVILDVLKTHIDNNADSYENGERARKVHLTAIPRPPEGLENLMAMHTSRYAHVKRHLKIVDDEEYFEVVDLVERNIPKYLDMSIPIEEQDDDKFDALVTSICEKMPSVRKYDDCWPIYLHIRRFLSARAAGLPRTPRENEPSGSTTPSTPPKHECPVLSVSPSSPVPPSVVALLSDYGMEELGPAFLFLGITSDAEFADLVTTPSRKREFLAGLPGPLVECSEFQATMIRYIVERV